MKYKTAKKCLKWNRNKHDIPREQKPKDFLPVFQSLTLSYYQHLGNIRLLCLRRSPW